VSKKEIVPVEVEKELKEAVKLNTANLEAFYQLGSYYKYKQDYEKAQKAFNKMIEIKANEPRASAELRLLNKRLEKKGGESSFLGLFKKKNKESSNKDDAED